MLLKRALDAAAVIDNLRSTLVCAADHGDPWAQLKRGKAVQLQQLDRLQNRVQSLPAHPIIAEFIETLEAVRAV